MKRVQLLGPVYVADEHELLWRRVMSQRLAFFRVVFAVDVLLAWAAAAHHLVCVLRQAGQ